MLVELVDFFMQEVDKSSCVHVSAEIMVMEELKCAQRSAFSLQ